MYRVFAIIINLILGLLAETFFQSDVTVNLNTPVEVVAGTEFEVTVNVRKGDLENFSRLQQNLPAGLTAVSSQSANADFSFENKIVRLIWLSMPRQDEFAVVYKIKVDERLKGVFNINGKFSYIDENERKSVIFESSQITILPSPTIDPLLVVDINDFERLVIPYIAPSSGSGQIACIRQQPYPDPAGGGYIVNILVNKEAKQKFAKIEEKIPAGFTAISLNPKESIFTFKGGTAKFLWMNLPASPYFTVSYKLVPSAGNSSIPQPNGKFSYLEQEKTISIDIKQTEQDVATLSPDEINQLLIATSAPQMADNNKKGKTVIIAADQSAKSKKTEKDKNKNRGNKNQNNQNQLEPETGVYYRVQLAAGHNPVNIVKYFRKFKLEKDVRKENHDGWLKYSIGSFPNYKDARDYRVHIWNTTPISDAFVSAYNDGNRITVQEALMIGNQQWYK